MVEVVVLPPQIGRQGCADSGQLRDSDRTAKVRSEAVLIRGVPRVREVADADPRFGE
jgi:hypothetical protein